MSGVDSARFGPARGVGIHSLTFRRDEVRYCGFGMDDTAPCGEAFHPVNEKQRACPRHSSRNLLLVGKAGLHLLRKRKPAAAMGGE